MDVLPLSIARQIVGERDSNVSPMHKLSNARRTPPVSAPSGTLRFISTECSLALPASNLQCASCFDKGGESACIYMGHRKPCGVHEEVLP